MDNRSKETLCWECANAVPCNGRGCAWSRRFKPVAGWVAKESQVQGQRGLVTSYRVFSCPQFIEG